MTETLASVLAAMRNLATDDINYARQAVRDWADMIESEIHALEHGTMPTPAAPAPAPPPLPWSVGSNNPASN